MKYTLGMVILGGHVSVEPVNSSFMGNPYLITRLYSLKYKVTCVVDVSRAWISRYILTLKHWSWLLSVVKGEELIYFPCMQRKVWVSMKYPLLLPIQSGHVHSQQYLSTYATTDFCLISFFLLIQSFILIWFQYLN